MPDVGGGGSVGRSEHSVSLTVCELKTNERISGIKVGVADLSSGSNVPNYRTRWVCTSVMHGRALDA